MRSTLESTLPWWVAGPVLGLVIVSLLGLANKRFGVLGGVTGPRAGLERGPWSAQLARCAPPRHPARELDRKHARDEHDCCGSRYEFGAWRI